MDFNFSDDQNAIRELASNFVADVLERFTRADRWFHLVSVDFL